MLLAQRLIQQIECGEFSVGDKLPNESRLSDQFGLSRVTVRSALSELEHRGLVRRRPRLGTVVINNRCQSNFVHSGESIESLLTHTRELSFRLLSYEVMCLTEEMAQSIRLPPGLRILRITGVRQKSNQPPALYSTHYIPLLYAPSEKSLHGLNQSIAEFLTDRHGDVVHEIEQNFDVDYLNGVAATALQADEKSAVLRTRRWYKLRSGALVLMSESVSPHGRYTFTSTLVRKKIEDGA